MFPLRQSSEIRRGDQWVCFKFISWAQNFAMSWKTAFVYVQNRFWYENVSLVSLLVAFSLLISHQANGILLSDICKIELLWRKVKWFHCVPMQSRVCLPYLTRKCWRAQIVAQPSHETRRQGITRCWQKPKIRLFFFACTWGLTPPRLVVFR